MNSLELAIKKLTKNYESLDPFFICYMKKIQCLEYPFSDGTPSLSYFYNGNWIILINKDLSNISKKFVCGHELGHILLHSNVKYKNYSTIISIGNKKDEKEADTFSLLLFPTVTFDMINKLSVEDLCHKLNIQINDIRYSFV